MLESIKCYSSNFIVITRKKGNFIFVKVIFIGLYIDCFNIIIISIPVVACVNPNLALKFICNNRSSSTVFSWDNFELSKLKLKEEKDDGSS